MAYVDGDAPPRVIEHIRSCATCAGLARQYGWTSRQLRQALSRFDCPSPQTLGDYNLDLVSPEERASIAAHVLQCPRCAEELSALRAFLAEPDPSPTTANGLVDRLRRVIATLSAPSPSEAAVALRGSAEASSRSYQAEDLTISLSLMSGERPGTWSLLGLVLGGATGPQAVAEAGVILRGPPGEQSAGAIDTLGNFAFSDLRPGRYELEITLPDRVVVLEDVVIDG